MHYHAWLTCIYIYLPNLHRMVDCHIAILYLGRQTQRSQVVSKVVLLISGKARILSQVSNPPALPAGGGTVLPGARASSEAHCVLVFSTK